MMSPPARLKAILIRLRDHYGILDPEPPRDPFQLILLENVAYLASPERRRAAWNLLERTVGTSPAAILRARTDQLRAVAAHGILAGTVVDKLRDCATIAMRDFAGDLTAVLDLPLPAAKRALRRFPGIGEPGAEKILLFSRRQALLAPESNGLRVLTRLGLVPEHPSYAKTYAAARALGAASKLSIGDLVIAHRLLHRHGQELCRRSEPDCPGCPLRISCPFNLSAG
jgi:endonuclease III